MSTHPREHEELLAAALAGERAAADPGIARLLAECATCAREWAEATDARRRLEGIVREEREAVEQLAAMRGAPGEERVLSALQRLAATEPHGARRRPSRAAWIAAAAVLLAAAWIVVRFVAAPGREEPPTPLGAELRIVAPRGRVPSYAPFSWTYPGAADAYAVRVYDAADAARSAPLLATRTKETSWTPAADDLAGLPARIAWEVDALDAQRNVLPGGSDSAEASRSP